MHRRILTLAALPLLAGLLAAEEPTPPPPPGPGMGHGPMMGSPAKMAEQFNKMKEKNPEFFKRIDTDGDGTISVAEVEAFQKKEQERRKEAMDLAFTEADKDKDGKLDRAEFEAAQRLVMRPPPRKDGDRGHEKGPEKGKDKLPPPPPKD